MSRGGPRPGAGRRKKKPEPGIFSEEKGGRLISTSSKEDGLPGPAGLGGGTAVPETRYTMTIEGPILCREPLGNIGYCANTVPCRIHPAVSTAAARAPRLSAKKSQAIVDVMEKAAAATAAHADAIEAMIPLSASPRERELREEIQRLREANRRLQAEGPAVERDKLIIDLRRQLVEVRSENQLVKDENALLKKTLAARPATTEHVDAVGIPLAGGKGKVTLGELRPMIQKGFGKLRERVQKVSEERLGCAGPGRCGRIGCPHT